MSMKQDKMQQKKLPAQTTPIKKSQVAFIKRLTTLVTDLLEIRGSLSWGELKRRIRIEFGRGWASQLRILGLRGLKHWCQVQGYITTQQGVSLDVAKQVVNVVFHQDENKMTIGELRRYRTEIAIYLGTRKAQCGLPKDICRYIGSILQNLNAFDSVLSDYDTTEIFRSERGLEKANGNLYELHKAIHKETGKKVTLELFEVDETGALPSFLVRELEMNRVLNKHPNIWQIVDEITLNDKVVIVRQYVNCTLSSVITKNGPMEENRMKHFLRQMFTFVCDCHRNKIICDGISSGSIYVGSDDTLRITRNPANFYDPPERLLADSDEKKFMTHSPKKDVWSLGCVFAKMALGKWLFGFDRSDVNDIDVLLKIFDTLGTPNYSDWPQAYALHEYFEEFPKFEKNNFKDLVPTLSPHGQDLLEKMLCFNPEDRISSHDALKHPFLQESEDSENCEI